MSLNGQRMDRLGRKATHNAKSFRAPEPSGQANHQGELGLASPGVGLFPDAELAENMIEHVVGCGGADNVAEHIG